MQLGFLLRWTAATASVIDSNSSSSSLLLSKVYHRWHERIYLYIYDVASLKNWTLYKPIYLKGQKNKFKSFEYNSKDSYTELMINAIVQMDHTASPNSFECVYRSFASWFIQTILLIFPHASWQHLAYNYRERPRCCRRRRRHHRHFNMYTYYIDDME